MYIEKKKIAEISVEKAYHLTHWHINKHIKISLIFLLVSKHYYIQYSNLLYYGWRRKRRQSAYCSVI